MMGSEDAVVAVIAGSLVCGTRRLALRSCRMESSRRTRQTAVKTAVGAVGAARDRRQYLREASKAFAQGQGRGC